MKWINQRLYFKKLAFVLSEYGFLLTNSNPLVGFLWVAIQFLYLFGWWYFVSHWVVRQFSLVSLAKLFWVVISLSLWICFGGEFIYPFLILECFLIPCNQKIYTSSHPSFIILDEFDLPHTFPVSTYPGKCGRGRKCNPSCDGLLML